MDQINIHISEYWEFIKEINDSSIQIKEIFKKFNDKLKEIKEGKKNLKKIIIIQQNELKNEILKEIFKSLKKLQEHYQLFIIFILYKTQ